MNSYNTDIFFSNYYNLQSVHFELAVIFLVVVLAFMNHVNSWSFLAFVFFSFSLAHHIVARILIKNLSEYFLREWKPFFPVGKLVRGKVLRFVRLYGIFYFRQ